MAKFPINNKGDTKGKIKATIQTLLAGVKDSHVWRMLQPTIEVSSNASIKTTIQTVLEGGKYGYVWPIFQ
jgi:hypothetical protein